MNLLPQYATRRPDDTIDHLLNTVQHADCMELLRRLPDASVDMVLCDLPYGVTACAWDTVIPIEPMWEQLKRIVKPRSAIVLTATQPFTSRLVSSNYEMYRHQWVSNKNNSAGFALAPFRPFQITEDVLVFGQLAPSYYPQLEERGKPRSKGGYSTSDNYGIDPTKTMTNVYYPKNIIEISNASQVGKVHPTQKPVALFEYLIKTYTQENEIVLDMACGSGTTAIAARKTGRRFICGDITQEYVELARKRLQDTDPYQATVLADGTKQLSLFERDKGA